MDTLKKKPFHFSVVFSLIGVLFLGATALYLSGAMKTITTTMLKPKASSAMPVITKNYVANFKSGAIDTTKWTVSSPADTKVAQTGADNLRMDIPQGNVTGPKGNKGPKQAQLVYTPVLKDKADFRVDVVAYRPSVVSTDKALNNGTAVEGIRFSSTGTANDEGAVVRWVVSGKTSTVQFVVTDKTGKVLVNESKELVSNIAILRLVRVNKEYRASFKAGNDYSSDLNWNALGVCDETAATNNCSATLQGQDGKVALFTHNAGVKDLYPQVVGRFDQARIGWQEKEGTPTPTSANPKAVSFSDAFNTGNLGPKWTPTLTTGTTVAENAAKNLLFTIPAGAVNNAPATGRITRTSPVVSPDKNFSYTATLYKPVVGNGTGWAGISFASTSNLNKEAANIRWVVAGKASRLLFLVRDRGGNYVEKASTPVTSGRLAINLRRNGNKYTAWYRVGDGDANWVQIGSAAEEDTLGEDGKFGIFVSNTGADKRFPAVTAQFDGASGTVQQ